MNFLRTYQNLGRRSLCNYYFGNVFGRIPHSLCRIILGFWIFGQIFIQELCQYTTSCHKIYDYHNNPLVSRKIQMESSLVVLAFWHKWLYRIHILVYFTSGIHLLVYVTFWHRSSWYFLKFFYKKHHFLRCPQKSIIYSKKNTITYSKQCSK